MKSDQEWNGLWIVLSSAAIAVGVVMMLMPALRYVRCGWAAKRKDIMGGLDANARYLYFKMFAHDQLLPADANASQEFEKVYLKWYGRRFFVLPLLLHGVVTTLVVSLVVFSVLDVSAHLKNPLFGLPVAAISALAGAYMWVTNDFISRARSLDFAPADILWGTLRMVVAVPMGYAFASIAPSDVGSFVAFSLGAFPLATLTMMLQRLTEKYLKLEPTEAEKSDTLSKLEGVDRAIRDRLAKEDITTISQVAYCDPVRLTMRSNLNFIFVTDLASQALAWLYLQDKLSDVRPLGLRGACEIRWLMQHYDLGESDLSSAKARDRTRAIAAFPGVATKLGQSSETTLNCFKQIADDPFTIFLSRTWINPDRPLVGILAYGSLIDHPDKEINEAVSRVVSEGVITPFKVEFARSSHARAGAPTLTPVREGGAHVPARILVLDGQVSEQRAIDMLLRRETCVIEGFPAVGIAKADNVIVERLENFEGFPVVLYVRIVPEIGPLTADYLANLAIQSTQYSTLQDLDGISYLITALEDKIKTPLGNEFAAAIMQRMGAPSLPEALAHARTLPTYH